MSDTPKFTVILSGYQTEPYLPKSLASIARQTYTDFEAICYVETSTDASLELCQEYARRDPRFKIGTGPKSGAVATTRNYGIDHAIGEYLVAIDGDDWLDERMLEKLARKLNSTGPVDVLAFAAVTTEAEEVDMAKASKLTNFRPSDAEGVFTGQEAIRRVANHAGNICNFTWLNAYRTAFLREHKLYQSDGLLMEDVEHTPRVWFMAEKFAYLDETLYVYRRRPNSLTTEASPRILHDLALQLRSLMEFAATHQIPGDIMAIWSNQWVVFLYWFMFHPVTSRKMSSEDRQRALETLFAGEGKARFQKLAVNLSLPKRMAIPLIYLAAKGIIFPAMLFFRCLYYPLNKMRSARG
ncbi:MAG: glycosyltransferase [Victivallales bacterium]|nr:glycosyltransferase [Victivallales bacterium]